MQLKSLIGLASLVTSASAAINPIQVNGTKFFDSTGKQFFIKGVAYQPFSNNGSIQEKTGAKIDDPLADAAGCTANAPLIKAMGANVIRVYRVNATLDHTACMNTFADAGIYLFLDLETPDTTVISDTPTWTVSQYNAFAANVDAFAKYPNTAGFFIGNENIDQYNRSSASPFVKAAARDMKAYIKSKNYRGIPVGYAGADVANLQIQLAEYLSCGSPGDGIDFYGINIYRWCGTSTFTQSGYDQLTKQYQELGRPAFFSEFGCNTVQPRTFGDVQALYSSQMTDIWSGGIAYEWVQEDNNYGLVTSASAGGKPTPLPDYSVLSSQWAKVTPVGTSLANYAGSTKSVSCPPNTSGFNAATALPPTPDGQYCACQVAAAKCVAAPNARDTAIANAFSVLCGLNNGAACSVVGANGSTGQYGAYSFCDGAQQLGLAFNNYYISQASASNACQFGGVASLVANPKSTVCQHAANAVAIATGSAPGASVGTARASAAGTSSGAAAGASTTKTANANRHIGASLAGTGGLVTMAGCLFGGFAFVIL